MRRSTPPSPRSWAGLGCVILVVASLLGLGVLLFLGQRVARTVRAQLSDTALLVSSARTSLGATVLPAGYEPSLSITVPLLGHVVILEAPPERADIRSLFLCLRHRGDEPPTVRDTELDTLLNVRGLSMHVGQTVARGSLALGNQRLGFRAVRAEIVERPAGRWPALAALIDVRCADAPGPSHFAAWIVSDPPSPADSELRAPTGSPADPEAIRAFMSAFRLCG